MPFNACIRNHSEIFKIIGGSLGKQCSCATDADAVNVLISPKAARPLHGVPCARSRHWYARSGARRVAAAFFRLS